MSGSLRSYHPMAATLHSASQPVRRTSSIFGAGRVPRKPTAQSGPLRFASVVQQPHQHQHHVAANRSVSASFAVPRHLGAGVKPVGVAPAVVGVTQQQHNELLELVRAVSGKVDDLARQVGQLKRDALAAVQAETLVGEHIRRVGEEIGQLRKGVRGLKRKYEEQVSAAEAKKERQVRVRLSRVPGSDGELQVETQGDGYPDDEDDEEMLMQQTQMEEWFDTGSDVALGSSSDGGGDAVRVGDLLARVKWATKSELQALLDSVGMRTSGSKLQIIRRIRQHVHELASRMARAGVRLEPSNCPL